MGTFTSPDRPATVLQRLVGIKDTEPPITDREYELYQRFTGSIRYAPRDIAEQANYPKAVNRRTRTAVRKFVSDPGLPGLLEALERAKARAIAADENSEREKQAEEAKAERERLQSRLAAIEAFHDNQLNELHFGVGQFQHLIGHTSIEEATLRIAQESQSDWTKNQRALNLKLASQGQGSKAVMFGALASVENSWRDKSSARGVASGMARFVIRRTLVSMSDAERATLRMADILAALGRLTADEHLRIAVPIAWNGGDCAYDFDTDTEFRERASMLEVFKQLMAASLGTAAGAREYLNQAVRSALGDNGGLPGERREIVERYLFSGNRWMSEAEGQRALARGDLSASALRIGGFPGGSGELLYDLRESLITIAPSGSGKSQAHVLRNLLYMEAPAVVLDIKGEMAEASRQWREREVGKTYVFSPREPDSSFHYNPLDDIGADPEQAWEDARTVADLMFKPAAKTRDDAYFEGRARDLLTTALLDVALSQKGAKRTMSSVLQLLYTSDDEEILAWCKRLEKRKSVQLSLQASALRGMPVKQRESLLDTARRHVEIWQSPSILKVTADTTFSAKSLRDEKATVYLKVTLEDVERYASVLRVLVGQTLLKLYRVVPESNAQIVTFFLDELPRLGRLDVIEQSLDMGRGYGVRLWLFCQNLGQLQASYPNAQGMMSNCAIRCFMNPDEDAARWLSENLSTRQGLLDGTRKPLVEPHQLTGPEFANQVVVFSRGQLPARLDKKPAHVDPICRDRKAGVEKSTSGEPSPVNEPPIPRTGEEEAVAADTDSEPVDWDTIRAAIPATQISAGAPVEKPKLGNAFTAGVSLAALVLACLCIWLGLERSKLQSVQTDNASLSASIHTVEGERRGLAQDKANLLNSLHSVEQARDRFRDEMEATRRALELERRDHAATRDQLASVRRDLIAERARPAAPVDQSPPQTQPASPQQPAVTAAPATAPSALPQVPSALPGATTSASQATDCDLLAGNPNDPRRVGAGAKYPDLKRNTAVAVEACDRALQASPNEQRFKYQKARALYAAGDSRARAMFDELLAADYPSAFDNAAQYPLREGRLKDAESLLRRGVQLQDPDAMVTLADNIKAGAMPARIPSEDALLYEMAARLGHQGAKTYVEQMQAVGNWVDQTGKQLFSVFGR